MTPVERRDVCGEVPRSSIKFVPWKRWHYWSSGITNVAKFCRVGILKGSGLSRITRNLDASIKGHIFRYVRGIIADLLYIAEEYAVLRMGKVV
ncbi:hypothetical protein NPIL_349751 [Nephila pilipes]|uniref:Uncharacterized protein n=1 Tax=Nephila pilipes TaxID=299642 RepID=A0A8X6U2G3_NEPPI|nr:hypothetical protein NPIL_349751 [Nephila pilipes]